MSYSLKIKDESSVKYLNTVDALITVGATKEVTINEAATGAAEIKRVASQYSRKEGINLIKSQTNIHDVIGNVDEDESNVIVLESHPEADEPAAYIKLNKSFTDQSFIEEFDADSVESLQSNASYLFQKVIEEGPNFFNVLGEIPDISEISSDIPYEVLRTSLKPIKSASVVVRDIGSFVNPLTGEEELESEPEEPEKVAEITEEVEEESEYERWDEEDQDLLVLAEADQKIEVEMRPSEDEVFETFLEMNNAMEGAIETEIHFETREGQTIHQHLVVITIDFLSELIRTVVEKCEYIDPRVILRHNLDNFVLMTDIESKVDQLNVEQKICAFLNRKTVEFFKRKKAFRSILQDSPDTVAGDVQRLKEATAKLNIMLGREEDVKSATAAAIASLNNEVISKEEGAEKEILDFEDLVKNSLRRDNFDKLPQVVINLLSRIEHLRDEVSEVQLTLIQRQHTFASLMEKLDKLENLGDGLNIIDFEHLQMETMALGKKIEEKNSELNKLRIRCNVELHIMSHMKEKQKMLRSTASIKKEALDDLQWQKQKIRERLFHLKTNRGRIRNEIRELNFQGGIFNKPALMFDYDDTVDRLKILQHKVNQYKNKYIELQKNIQKLEGKCE